MKNHLRNKVFLAGKIFTKGIWHPNATILMYHRVLKMQPDPWLLAVSPENFDEQVQVLRQYNVLSMSQFIENLKKGKLSRSLVITFDDGYKDNFDYARPMLSRAGLPATFFVSSGYTGRRKQFWSNDLDELFLTEGKLPEKLEITTKQVQFSYELEEDSFMLKGRLKQYQNWIAWEAPPSRRHSLYVEIAKLIKSLPANQEDGLLKILYEWSGKERVIRPENLMMDESELKELSANSLFEIGGHTVSHPELSSLPAAEQYEEITANIASLEKIVQRKVTGMAYPYGAYNEDTLQAVKKAGLHYACITQQRPVYKDESFFTLPRLRVRNWNGAEFKTRIDRWLKLGV